MRLVTTVATAVLVAGCSHPLDVRNLDQYRSASLEPLLGPLTIGVVPSAPDRESQRLVGGIGGALGKRAARVHFPYAPTDAKPVDVVARVSVKPTYHGSGWNFLINFPGFLVWAPAWNGYVYGIDYKIDVELIRATDGASIDRWQVPVALDIRHSSMGRTWTEVSWLEWGVIALIGGIAFVQYNPGVTPLVVDRVEGPLGDYVAQQIVARVNGAPSLWTAEAPPAEAVAAPEAMAAPVGAAVAAAPGLVAGSVARLRPGLLLRTRALPEADTIATIAPGEPLTLKASMRNASGTWWYVTSAKGSGWVRDSDLEPITP